MSSLSRREFIGAAAIGAAALTTGTTTVLGAALKKLPIGVQLYSVRNEFPKDFPGVLAGVKKIGYEGVEFAGYASYSNDAKGLRKLLDDSGLKPCGTHLQGGLQLLTDDHLEQTVEFNKILGNDKLIVASVTAHTVDQWKAQADIFTAMAAKLKPHNMRLGYHNHVAEFTPMDGQMPEDIFFGQASPDVFMQLDIGHCGHAGGDPAAYIRKYSGRVLTLHVKDWNPETRGDIVGEGVVKWPAVVDAIAVSTALQWGIIEEESNKFSGLDGITKDFANWTKFLNA